MGPAKPDFPKQIKNNLTSTPTLKTEDKEKRDRSTETHTVSQRHNIAQYTN